MYFYKVLFIIKENACILILLIVIIHIMCTYFLYQLPFSSSVSNLCLCLYLSVSVSVSNPQSVSVSHTQCWHCQCNPCRLYYLSFYNCYMSKLFLRKQAFLHKFRSCFLSGHLCGLNFVLHIKYMCSAFCGNGMH